MKRFVAAIAASSLLAACASAVPTIRFAPDASSAATGKTLVSVDQDAPGFTPFEAAGAAFGAIGGLAMASAASTFAQQNGIVDPAPAIEARLKAKLAQTYSATSGETVSMKGVKEATPYPKREGVLFVDAKTYFWQYIYFSFDWGHYAVQYNVLIQLVDGGTGKVLGQYDCKKKSHEDPKGAPTKEELLANKSELLNKLLTTMADACASEFEAEVLAPAAT